MATTPNRVDDSVVVKATQEARILVVDAALVLQESYLSQLRSIPAMVERLACCADLYRHDGQAYALVMLALHVKSTETADAANFIRHRWSSARILLLEGESATIDDWLYDERIDPHLDPAAVRETAIRLMTEEQHWIAR